MIIFDGIIFDLQDAGGISRYFSELVRAAASSGKLPFVFATSKRGIERVPEDLRCYVHSYKERMLERIRPFKFSPATTDSRMVFHSSYYRLHESPLAKNVVTIHDMIPELFGHSWSEKALAIQKRHAIKHADHIITVSRSTKLDLLKMLPEVERIPISVIHNGISPAFRYERSIRREHRAVFVGSRRRYKDFAFSIELMRSLEQYHLDIIGGGALDDKETELLNQACSARYHHHAYLTDEQLNRLYNRAKILIYPSRYEGFGLPPLEAMRAGCIPIYRANSSIPEVVGSAGIDIAGRPAEIVAEDVYRLEDLAHFQSLQSVGFSQADQFSWEKSAMRTIAVYESLLS